MNLAKLLAWDKRTSERMRLNRNQRGLWYLAVFFAHSGDSWWWLNALLLVWLADKIWKLFKGSTIKFTGLLAVAILSLAIIILAIKFIVRRTRPKGEWGDIYRKTDPHSFPSGHAARAFLIALIMLEFGPTWLGIVMLIWAFCVSLARVALGVHYFSDIVVGMLVGLLWGWLIIILTPLLSKSFPFIFT
jgi:undecaprenyl-diphosphatase